MNCDTSLHIGSSHSVCQDYCRNGDNYVILSDGCSSSPDTDFGARLLVTALEKQFKSRYFNHARMQEYYEFAVKESNLIANNLGLHTDCLDATLISAVYQDGILRINAWGDGVIAIKFLDGQIHHYLINYVNDGNDFSNAPYYLNYLIKPEKDKMYKNLGQRRVEKCFNNGKLIGESSNVAWDEPMSDILLTEENQVDYVVIISDGAESFLQSDRKTPIEFQDVLDSLVGFKNFKGDFVKRRVNAFINKMNKDGAFHYDDLSIGAIKVENGNSNPEGKEKSESSS